MKSRLAFAVIVLALVVFPSTGCVVAAAGAGAAGAAYVMGSLDASLPSNPERIVEASKGVLQDSDIHVLESDATNIDGSVVGRTALDRRIEITVKRVDEKQSKISIRVGTFGDRDVSQDLLDRIRARVT